MRKTIFLTMAAAAVMAMSPALAMAQVNDTSVLNSGDRARVSSTSNETTSVNVSNTNNAAINQMVNASANTGGNRTNGNISLGGGSSSIVTGAAGVASTMGVSANSNVTGITMPASSGSNANGTDVINTGDRASVNTSTNTVNRVNVANNNTAFVNQSCSRCNANTGNNASDSNIGGASITTGPAGVTSQFGVDVNRNTTSIDSMNSMPSGGANFATVTNTGDRTNVNSNALFRSTIGISNSNTSNVRQSMNVDTNTGRNSTSNNIGGGSIMTSGAFADATFGVRANSNATGIGFSGMNMSFGGNLHDIINTGDNLNSNTSYRNNTSVQVTNSNTSRTSQSMYSRTTTGYNVSDNSIGAAGIGTGIAGAGTVFGFTGNSNVTAVGGMLGDLFAMMSWI